MLKLKGPTKSYIWGGTKLKTMYGKNGDRVAESWEVSVHPDGASECDGGTLLSYLEKVGTAVDKLGSKLPVLIKFIDAASNLSVQVHPNDEYARINENDNGKTEMWYIIDAEKGAGIYCGFKRDTDKEEFLRKTAEGTVEELLNFIPVKKGDCFLIKAGTVHAICSGCVICEVQQSSNVTYRVYDYNRKGADGKPRELHVNKAVDVINFKKYVDETNTGKAETIEGGSVRLLTKCEYFKCRELILRGAFKECNENSFTAINIIDGEGQINGAPFKAGDSFFVDRGEEYVLSGEATVILTCKP